MQKDIVNLQQKKNLTHYIECGQINQYLIVMNHGSTFKLITASVGLEEGIVGTDGETDFVCNGYEYFQDGSSVLSIACWRYYNPHGTQSLREALCNSCNPAFMQLAAQIGTTTLFKYYEAFGLMDKTSSGLYGEQNSIFHDEEDMGTVELATYSFGQRFQVTPLQMITAVSAIANDGVLMQPRIVESITNPDTGVVTEIATEEVRQVISETTASQVVSMMESVVTDGTGSAASVVGYEIGGKTGTSEPTYANIDDGYVASYVAISPIEDTEVVLLLTLYNPTNGLYQGGQVAGPVVSQMLSEILPYLEVPSTLDTTTSTEDLITVPDIENKTITEARKTLENLGFSVETSSITNEDTTLVSNQTPIAGTLLNDDSIIILYGEGNDVATSVSVPNLSGMTISEATSALHSLNLNISYDGSGTITNQDYMSGELVPEGTVIKVTLKSTTDDGY